MHGRPDRPSSTRGEWLDPAYLAVPEVLAQWLVWPGIEEYLLPGPVGIPQASEAKAARDLAVPIDVAM